MESTKIEQDIFKEVDLICLDHKEFSETAFDEFQKTLKSVGIFIYELESSKKSDTWIIIVSKKELDKDDLNLVDLSWQQKFAVANGTMEGLEA